MQYGSQQKYFTKHAYINFTDKVIEHLDNGKFVFRILIDFQEVFDSVNGLSSNCEHICCDAPQGFSQPILFNLH